MFFDFLPVQLTKESKNSLIATDVIMVPAYSATQNLTFTENKTTVNMSRTVSLIYNNMSRV